MPNIHIEWYGDRDETHRRVVRQPGMSAATSARASKIAARADAKLQRHKRNNDKRRAPGDAGSSISVTKGSVDAFVNLDDPQVRAAMAISKNLNILWGAAYRL